MFFEVYGDNRDLTVLTHSLPTRRASDLVAVDRHLERVALGAIPVGRFDRVSLGGIGLAAGGKFHGDGEGLHFDLGGCVHDQFLSIRKGRLRPGSKPPRSEEHTSELQSIMRISYAVLRLKQKTNTHTNTTKHQPQQHTIKTE